MRPFINLEKDGDQIPWPPSKFNIQLATLPAPRNPGSHADRAVWCMANAEMVHRFR